MAAAFLIPYFKEGELERKINKLIEFEKRLKSERENLNAKSEKQTTVIETLKEKIQEEKDKQKSHMTSK